MSIRIVIAEDESVNRVDLEEVTMRLLEENTAVRERIRAQFEQVLMDEFQDTNGLQAKLLQLVRPPDRFFAVGDINQSIYGFRHAEPDVFRDYREEVKRGAAMGEDADTALALEAKWVARRILEMEGTLALRKHIAGFGDFAVLLRNSEVMGVFAAAFPQTPTSSTSIGPTCS